MLTALYHTKKARFVKSDSFRALGAGKNLSKLASAGQSIARYSTDNPFARGVDKVFNTAGKYAKKAYDTIRK